MIQPKVITFKAANQQQEDFMSSKTRFFLLSGAVRAGKSFAGDWKVFMTNYMYPGNRALICRKNRVTLPGTTIRTLLDIIPPEMIIEHSEFKGKLIHKTRLPGVYSEIIYTGLDRSASQEVPQKIGSYEFGTIFLDEGSETDQGDWDMLVTRLNFVPKLASDPEYAHMYKDFINQMFTATNPESAEHYLYKFFFESENANREYRLITPYDNIENLPPGYIESLEESLIGVNRERLLHGKWVASTGMIFADFNRQVQVDSGEFLEIGDYKDIIAGADSNYPLPRACVILGVRGDQRVDVLAEFYEERAHVEQLIEWLEEKASDWDRTITVYHDPSDPAAIDKINAGKKLVCYKADNKVVPGISTVAKYFTKDLIRIHPLCTGLIAETLSYRWAKNREGEKPEKSNDHAVDSIRYALHSYMQGMRDSFVLVDREGIVF